MIHINVPVLIIGGGGCGLTSSIFLSELGIENLLVERHPSTSHLPKGHYLNQRTMEIFRQYGISDLIFEKGTPLQYKSTICYRNKLDGDKPYDGRKFFEIDAFGGGELQEVYEKDSPTMCSNLPQIRLEPILRQEAEKRAPGKILFSHELMEWSQDDEAVMATVMNRNTKETFTVHAQYMIAGDGGKTVGPKIGVKMEGQKLANRVSVHFKADLSKWAGDGKQLLTYIPSPEGHSCLIPMGPTWGPHSEEWILHQVKKSDDPEIFDEENIIPAIRKRLGIPDLKLTVLKVSNYFLDSVLADRYRDKRIFLGGDATHRHPPTTGLGINTAIQDAHNLTWKLAAVIKGEASDSLLDSYEAERRAIGRRNVNWATFSTKNNLLLCKGIGLMPGMSDEEHEKVLEGYFANTPQGATWRACSREVFKTQRIEFQAHDLELGFYYQEGALVSDGTEAPEADPFGRTYCPVTRPGHRLPHAWIEREGERISTHDLVNKGEFLLITGTSSEPWREAAKIASNTVGMTIKTVSIGNNGDFEDPTLQWKEVCGISEEGAILVRPDNHVAWRTMVKSENPSDDLTKVMASILNQKILVHA